MKRSIEQKLTKWRSKKDRKPLILKGARQIGKTYILQKFGEENFAKVHYLNFERRKEKLREIFDEDLDPKRIIETINMRLDIKINIKNDLLIFDEIQECPKALTSLKYFCEDMPELAIAAAGSLLGVQLSEEPFPVGKVDHLYMFPMSFEEFLLGIGKTQLYETLFDINARSKIPNAIHSLLWELLKIYFVIGGLPEVVSVYAEEQENLSQALKLAREKQEELILNYRSDMTKHCGKENAMHLDKLWTNIPIQLSREQDGSASKFKFKGVIPEKNRYTRLESCIDWLMNAGLIFKVPIINNAQIPFKAYADENKFKLFIFDIGILGALGEIPFQSILEYAYGTYKGYFTESFVAQEFVYADSKITKLYSWRKNTAEVEFVREVEGKILPVEVKSGSAIKSKSLSVFSKKYNPEYRTKMSARNLHIDTVNSVHNYPLYLASRFPLQ